MNKVKCILIIIFWTLYLICYSQEADSISAGWGRLDYSVPESPAFKILGSNPSSISRPSSTKEIAISVGNYFLSNGPVIPKNLAVEISPALLSNNLNLKKYQSNKFWYRSAFSLGTNMNDNNSYDFGVGFRFTISDKTDIRANNDIITEYYKITTRSLSLNDTIRMIIDNEEKNLKLSDIDDALDNKNNKDHERLQRRADELKITLSDDILYSHIAEVDKIRKAFKDSSWNKQIIQIGFSGLFPSKDSLAKNLSTLSKAGLWFAAGLPAGKNGQWLLGARILGTQRDSSKSIRQWDESVGARYYYGKNATKVYLEAESILKNTDFNMFTYSINVGGELNLFNSLWIDFAFGLSKTNNQKATFVPSINLKLGNGEKK